MASIRRSAASALSRILTLRYQPLCARCSKMLKGWEDGCPHSWEWDWHTTIGNLKDDSRTCSCCQFLVQALDASPWIQHKNQDELHIRTEHVGSQHSRSPLSKDQASTDFKAYYRPVLCVAWRPGDDHGRRSNSMDLGRNCTWILPEATAHTEIECSLDPQTFCGRRIGPLVDFSLIRGWLKTCTRSHQGREHKEPQKETDQVDSPESDCRPNRRESIPDFRLVDVHKRCVVRANPAEDYAALSYVWGNAKRLLLCESTQDWLSTPGALSPDEDRIPQTFKDTLKVAETLGISHVWIDALCINQTDMKQVESHMNAMGSIYGAALLTIVSNTENADTGIPGVSLLRGFPQASFHRKGISYLSARKTFAQALERSPWQKRAWCLQEKLFSKRLLIFTSSQAFYHCDAATWFEDTIMEPKDKYSTSLQVSEKVWIDRKSKEAIQRCTAYESYRSVLYERGFWSLVEDYSQRQLSFDGDAIRAFAGILKSVESQHGVALWGIPQYHFIRGISWYHTEHKAHLRRGGVPSWSWAGWRTDANNSLKFASCKRRDTDVGFSHGQYRVACGKRAQPSVWDIQWYYYAFDENSGQMETTTVQLEPGDTGAESRGGVSTDPSDIEESLEPPTEQLIYTDGPNKHLHVWGLPDHPHVAPFSPTSPPTPLQRDTDTPPLSHVLHFYTSVATVLVDSEPVQPMHGEEVYYNLLTLGTDVRLRIELDPQWSGLGKEHHLIYISRYCNEYFEWGDERDSDSSDPELIHVLLVESVPGWGKVKRRVQLVQKISILDWRKMDPRWELVSLA